MQDTTTIYKISDEAWAMLEPHLPGRKGTWGGNARDNRQFIDGVFWVLRTGAPWRDLPAEYGDWKNTHRRFCRWRDRGVWEKLLELLVDQPDYEWLIFNPSHFHLLAPAPQSKTRYAKPGRPKRGPSSRYLWPWMRMICRSETLSQKVPDRIARQLLMSSLEQNQKTAQ